MGKPSRDKGNRVELAIVALHLAIGVHAKKVSRMYGPDEDVLVYTDLYPACPLVCEVKGRKSAKGYWQKIKDAIDGKHVLFLKEDREEPLVVLPWAVWARIIGDGNGP